MIKLHHQTPVVGICFGHQIIARALGSRVGRNPNGWEVAVSDVNLTEPGKELFGREILVHSPFSPLEMSLTEVYSISPFTRCTAISSTTCRRIASISAVAPNAIFKAFIGPGGC